MIKPSKRAIDGEINNEKTPKKKKLTHSQKDNHTSEDSVKTEKSKNDVQKKFNKKDAHKNNQSGKKSVEGKPNKFISKPKKIVGKPETPTDWIEFKKKKKELRSLRKQNRNKSIYELIVKAKKVAENLRRKTLQGGEEERNKLVQEIHSILGGQGHYAKLVLAHDMARVVQYLLKFGTPEVRSEVSKELIPSTVQMITSKYAKFTVEKMFKYGSNETRIAVIDACFGSIVKLVSHSISAGILANAYAEWATKQQKQYMQQEFYGDIYKKSKDKNVSCISDVYKQIPEMKTATLRAVKANLDHVLSKELLDSQLIHAVLIDYMNEIREQPEFAELITTLAPHAVVLANTKDGAKIVMKCIWYGTNKDRKVIMRAFKEHVKDLACHEHAHTALITIFDSVDDTVLLSKMLLSAMLPHAVDLAHSEWGRKVLLWIVAPADSHNFHPTFITELNMGRTASTCKKEPKVRQQELLNYSIKPLLEQISKEPEKWLDNSSVAMVALFILKAGAGSELKAALSSISGYICDPDWCLTENSDADTEQKTVGIEHAGLHMVLKKLAQNDKVVSGRSSDETFGNAIVEHLSGDTIKKWIKTNRGCFFLITLFESNTDNIKDHLKKLISKHTKRLEKQSFAGSNILLKKLKENVN